MRADLEWFRTFKAIFETGTMSEAAKELHISQPGVSLHLNSLESYIGYPLFERSTRKMIPNERAKHLYQRIIGSMHSLEETENSFRKKSGTGRMTLSLGMYPGLFSQLLEKHISMLNFNFVVHLEDNDKLIELLENGTVDIIVTTKQKTIRDIVYEDLGDSRFIIAAGKDTDTTEFYKLDMSDKKSVLKWFKSQLWFNTSDRNLMNTFWKINFNKEPDFAANYIVPDKFSIVRSMSHGPGLAVLPESMYRDSIAVGNLEFLWEGYTEMKNKLYIGHKKRTHLNDEIAQIKKIIIEEFDKNH